MANTAIPSEVIDNFEKVFKIKPDLFRLDEIISWYGQEEIGLALEKLLHRKRHKKYRNPYGLLIVVSKDFQFR